MPYFHKNGCNSETTEVIYMAVELDQDSIATNMCVKFGENWTNSFQELDHTNFSGKKIPYLHNNGRNSKMTEVIYMAVKLDQDIMTTNMCVKLGENSTNTLQELDYTNFSGCTYVQTYVRTRATLYASTL